MNKLLTLIGGGWLLSQIFGAVGTNIADKITYGFRSVKKESVRLFESTFRMEMVLTNNNSTAFVVDSFSGTANYGAISIPINMENVLKLMPNETIIAKFSIKVNNADFLVQLGEQIENGGLPTMKISGWLTGGLTGGKVVTVPINQNVQIL